MKKEVAGMLAALGIGIAAATLSVFSGGLLLYFTDYLVWWTLAVSTAAGIALAVLANFLRKKLRDIFDLKTLTFLVFANVPGIIVCTTLWIIENFAERGEEMFAGMNEAVFAFLASMTYALCLIGEFIGIGVESYNRKRKSN